MKRCAFAVSERLLGKLFWKYYNSSYAIILILFNDIKIQTKQNNTTLVYKFICWEKTILSSKADKEYKHMFNINNNN